MNWRDVALGAGGVIGCATALAHGVLVQKFMVRPIEGLAEWRTSDLIRRLVAPLLHFSTFNWFVGGLALVWAAAVPGQEARLAVGLIVASAYLFAMLGNAWASRGRHPGWVLMALALVLIAVGLRPAA